MAEATRRYKEKADTVYGKLQELSMKSGFTIEKTDDVNRRLILSRGMSAFSWGETAEICVSQHENESTVTVSSKPRVWFNVTAEKRAERNVRNLIAELDRSIGDK